MDSYGLTLEGKFTVERVSTRPDFNEDQIGRFIFVETNETYWVGGINSWLSFGITNNSIKSYHVDWGNEYGQINAKTIPFVDNVYNYIGTDNVEDALLALSTGIGLADDCIVDRLIGDDVIKNEHISWGTTDNNVGGKDVLIDSLFPGNFRITNLQEAVNQLETSCPIIIREVIPMRAWESVPADNLYRTPIVTVPIDNPHVIVQCYDLTGKMINPARITTDLTASKIYIYMPTPISFTVVILG